MFEEWHWVYLLGIASAVNLYYHFLKSLFDGGDRLRQDE
jgi:hypothetical protein